MRQIIFTAAENAVHNFNGSTEYIKRRSFEIADVVNGGNALVRVFGEQSVYHLSRLAFVFGKIVFFTGLLRSLASRERLFPKRRREQRSNGSSPCQLLRTIREKILHALLARVRLFLFARPWSKRSKSHQAMQILFKILPFGIVLERFGDEFAVFIHILRAH